MLPNFLFGQGAPNVHTSRLNWHLYGSVEMMALIDEMSKPKRAPPI